VAAENGDMGHHRIVLRDEVGEQFIDKGRLRLVKVTEPVGL
jgi:hypothetical protein